MRRCASNSFCTAHIIRIIYHNHSIVQNGDDDKSFLNKFFMRHLSTIICDKLKNVLNYTVQTVSSNTIGTINILDSLLCSDNLHQSQMKLNKCHGIVVIRRFYGHFTFPLVELVASLNQYWTPDKKELGDSSLFSHFQQKSVQLPTDLDRKGSADYLQGPIRCVCLCYKELSPYCGISVLYFIALY